MPPKDYNQTQLLFKTENGEYQPIEMGVSLEDCAEIVSDVDRALSNPEYFKGGEFSFELTDEDREQFSELAKPLRKAFEDIEKLFKRTLLCNNWRKMHYLPLIRQRGKRK